MKLSGEELIPAGREAVWRALNDPDVLRDCIPGCQSVTRLSDTEMEAAVTVALGPLKVNFTGHVTLSDLDPPNSYRIAGEGSGGVAGSASGGANVRLEDVPGGTRLSYDVDAQVGGKLATMGARFIDPVSRKLSAQFFEKFAAVVTSAQAAGSTSGLPVERPIGAAVGVAAETAVKKRGFFSRLLRKKT